jgi:hypothetical protein
MRRPRGFWNNGMLSWLTASNFPLYLNAARLRFGIKPNGCGWAAAGDRRALGNRAARRCPMPILFALFLAIFVSQVSVNAAEKIRIGFNPGASGIYFPLAQKKGFFKEEGIEAEVIRLSGGVAVAAAGQRRRRLLHGPFFATGSGLRPSH